MLIKSSEVKIYKKRMFGIYIAVKNGSEHIEIDKLLTNIFVVGTTPVAKKLIATIEDIVLHIYDIDFSLEIDKAEEKFCKMYSDEILIKFQNIVDFIHANKAYREYLDFIFYILNTMNDKDKDTKQIYYSILMEIMNEIKPLHYLVGLSNNNEPIYLEEPFPNLELITQELYEKERNKKLTGKDWQKAKKQLAIHNIDFSNKSEFLNLHYEESIICNNRFHLAPFLDEELVPLFHSDDVEVYIKELNLRHWKETSFYKEKLKKRRYLLCNDGVFGIYINANRIKAIYFREVLKNNNIILLYQVISYNNKIIDIGWYNPKECVFISSLKAADTNNKSLLNEIVADVENFILENYYHLTCDVEIDRKRAFALQTVDDFKDMRYPNNIGVVFNLTETKKSTNKNKESRSYIRNKELYSISKKVMHHTRKLPAGWHASDEAIAKAEALGIELREGETFVSPFEKKVYRKDS
ncbi:MAG: hypothetical protein ACOCRK_02160 [bacterium]